jgi:hypothetical protein
MCGDEIVEVDILLRETAIDEALRETLRGAHLPRNIHNLPPLLLHAHKLNHVRDLLLGRLHLGLLALGVGRRPVNERKRGRHNKGLSLGIVVGANRLQDLFQLLEMALLAHAVRLVDGQVADCVEGGEVRHPLLDQVPEAARRGHNNGRAPTQQPALKHINLHKFSKKHNQYCGPKQGQYLKTHAVYYSHLKNQDSSRDTVKFEYF